MKKQTKRNLIRASVGAGLVWGIHYFLHAYASFPFVSVGWWLLAVVFIYLAFVEEKLF